MAFDEAKHEIFLPLEEQVGEREPLEAFKYF